MTDQERLFQQNLEALTDGESLGNVQFQCGGSMVVYCKAKCNSCGAIWSTYTSYGPPTYSKGQCYCGSSLFTTDIN